MRYSALSELCSQKKVQLKLKYESSMRKQGTSEVYRITDENDVFAIRLEPFKITPSMEGWTMLVYCETKPYDREYVSIHCFTGSYNAAMPGLIYVGDTMSSVTYRPIQNRRIESDYESFCSTFNDCAKVRKMLEILMVFLSEI